MRFWYLLGKSLLDLVRLPATMIKTLFIMPLHLDQSSIRMSNPA